jgi:catechol 2,3-dioxygenase-like lactoylglutathione lyase family enzyme
MSEYLICGIQQVGVGVPDLDSAFRWYRRSFGTDIRVFEDDGEAALMLAYTGEKPRPRRALLAANLQGGGGLEIWQSKGRPTEPPDFQVRLGDLGILAVRIKSREIDKAYGHLSARKAEIVGEMTADPGGDRQFFLKDPHGLMFQVVEANGWFSRGKHPTGGVAGCLIGTSDVQKACRLYTDVLGYDRVIYDEQGVFEDLRPLPGGDGRFRRLLLGHSEKRQGAFSPLLGPTRIELIQTVDRRPRQIFAGRQWGDLGFIHLCFDVRGMEGLKERCARAGFPFTVDSAGGFDMGDASGRFCYTEDPDGTLVEFVESYKLAIMKKWGWYLDLTRRGSEKTLPRWMLRALAFNRVKD